MQTQLKYILKKSEDSKNQFKLRFNSIDALAAEISAMANSEGGHIYVGITNSGEFKGVSNIDKLNQMISNACSQKIDPPISVVTENIEDQDRIAVIIKVPIGSNKPYAVNKGDYWIKVGSDKRRASREELRRLMQASFSLYADETPVVQTSLADIDMYAFRQFFEDYYGVPLDESGLELNRILSNLKLMDKNTLTLAGILLFAKQPEIIKPQYLIKAVAFSGNDVSGDRYLDNEDIRGTLPQAFKSGMAFLKRNLHKRQNGQNVNFPGIIEIPEIALEEAYVNALIHRDYFINSGIRLFVFDDRIEIISPGKLPNTVTTENIKNGIQIVRNPILISFVPKLKIPYRGIGSGILRIINECRKAGIKPPDFVEDKQAELFKVIFYRSNSG